MVVVAVEVCTLSCTLRPLEVVNVRPQLGKVHLNPRSYAELSVRLFLMFESVADLFLSDRDANPLGGRYMLRCSEGFAEFGRPDEAGRYQERHVEASASLPIRES